MLMDWRGGREARLVRQITGIGYQDFEEIRDGGIFYIDKSLRKESKVVQTKKQL